MAGPPYPKNPLPLPPFSSVKSSSSSSSPILPSSKLKSTIQSFILSHLYRIARALAKAKTLILQVIKNFHVIHMIQSSIKKNGKNKKKLFMGSFQLHYNWCSSHIMPVPAVGTYYYDNGWKTLLENDDDGVQEMGDCYDPAEERLSGYLHWLEKKTDHQEEVSTIEIDRLADMFIESCHEKFRLEKLESYRRFQEMMARSI